MSISSLSCILLNIYLSYYGAIHYGIAGVLAATIVAFGVGAVISGIYITYHYNILAVARERAA
jgi:Na+-driven multidrug efflux pump